MKGFYFLIITFCLSVSLHAQSYNRGDYNRLGLKGKYVILDIKTDNFATSTSSGYGGGFLTRGGFYNNFDMIFGLDLFQADINVMARENALAPAEETQYKILAAQLNVLASYLILDQNLTIEAGPVLMVNSKMELKDAAYKNYIVDGYTSLKTQDIEDISKINLNALIGLTAGFESFRATVNYQYGLLNTLNDLNDKDLSNTDPAAHDFKGNLSIITAGIIFYL